LLAHIVGSIVAMAVTLAADSTQAGVALMQSSHGISGTIADLGNGVGIQSDPHGQGGEFSTPLERTVPLPPGPHGELNQRAVTPFGSPLPPSQMTPAPILPFQPNRPLVPSPTTPPAVLPPTGSQGGRLGR
jgi:hypothetical protein